MEKSWDSFVSLTKQSAWKAGTLCVSVVIFILWGLGVELFNQCCWTTDWIKARLAWLPVTCHLPRQLCSHSSASHFTWKEVRFLSGKGWACGGSKKEQSTNWMWNQTHWERPTQHYLIPLDVSFPLLKNEVNNIYLAGVLWGLNKITNMKMPFMVE